MDLAVFFFCFTHKLRLGNKHEVLQVAVVMNLQLLSSATHMQVRAYAIAVRYFEEKICLGLES